MSIAVTTIGELLSQTPTISALPMHQVWATCVFHGKDVDNRSLPTRKQGTILVYATVSRKGQTKSLAILDDREKLLGRSLLPNGTSIYYGALLGAMDITGCTDNSQSDEWIGTWGMPRSWHWHLSNPRKFPEPIPVRPGSQGWFLVNDEFLAKQRDRGVELV